MANVTFLMLIDYGFELVYWWWNISKNNPEREIKDVTKYDRNFCLI